MASLSNVNLADAAYGSLEKRKGRIKELYAKYGQTPQESDYNVYAQTPDAQLEQSLRSTFGKTVDEKRQDLINANRGRIQSAYGQYGKTASDEDVATYAVQTPEALGQSLRSTFGQSDDSIRALYGKYGKTPTEQELATYRTQGANTLQGALQNTFGDPNMYRLKEALAASQSTLPKREEVTKQAQQQIDPQANMARANLQQESSRRQASEQAALARQLAARGRIGGPASEALKQNLQSQANAALSQGLSQVEAQRMQEVNRLVSQEIDRAQTTADKQFTAAAGLIAMGANTDEVIKQMGAAFQNDLSKIAIQNRFVAEQAAIDRGFRMELTKMGQAFEETMTRLKLNEQEKSDVLGLISNIVGAGARIGSFLINPLAGAAVNAGLSR